MRWDYLKRKVNKILPIVFILILICLWQIISDLNLTKKFMLPSFFEVVHAFILDFSVLMLNAKTTFTEAFIGITLSIILGFIFACIMDRFSVIRDLIYQMLIITQTIPTVAIAPLLVLWLGYDMLPKIVLVVIMCFFPITISLLDGFLSADKDSINLIKAMGGSNFQAFRYVKLPNAVNSFFSGLKIALSYSVVGTVISEWLGGYSGLGVYMMMAKKSYAFDKMFAVIIFVSMVSLLLMKIISVIQKRIVKWEDIN